MIVSCVFSAGTALVATTSPSILVVCDWSLAGDVGAGRAEDDVEAEAGGCSVVRDQHEWKLGAGGHLH